MQTITNYIKEQLSGDLVAQEALERGILNMRAYGRSVRATIETARGEKVDLATIAVALSRLEKKAQAAQNNTLVLKLNDLTVQAPLVDITYPKNAVGARELETIARRLDNDSGSFIAVTQGYREATIIVSQRHERDVTDAIDTMPLYTHDDLFAVTVHFPIEYMRVPNIIYRLVASVAAYRVNLIEIISTLTELSFVVEKENVDTVTKALQKYL